MPLLGAQGYLALVNQADRLAALHGVHPYRIRHLLDRYGSEIHELLSLAADDASLLQPIPGADDYLQVEALYATTHEGALHLEDVLARRTRISIEYAHRGTESMQRVAEIMAPVLGWSDDETAREVEVYRARVDAERRSQTRTRRRGGRQGTARGARGAGPHHVAGGLNPRRLAVPRNANRPESFRQSVGAGLTSIRGAAA